MFKFALAAVAAVTSINSAQAATIFTDRASFDAATTGSTSQSFPASSVNQSNPTYTFNNVTFNTTLAGDRNIIQDGLFQGAVYLATGLGGSVTISSTLNAIGLYLGSADGARSFGYTVNGTTGTFTALNSINNGGKFIGFADTSPISVTFNTSSGREFDIVSYVTTTNPVVTPPVVIPPIGAVPEPATWAMMIFGFGLVGGAMRRRKQQITVRFA
jgi:hypothetical protein